MTLTHLHKTRTLFLMAVDAEYGPNLRARFAPVLTGVGPVEAALVTTATLVRMQCAGTMPELVISLGSAGAARLEQGAVYQAGAVAYRDMDASPLGFLPGITPFLDQPAEIAMPLRVPGVPVASLSTGGAVISGTAYDAIAQDMVDMETFATLRACQHFGVPLIALRGISDGAAPLEGLHSWTEYLHVVDERLAAAVDVLRDALAGGMDALRMSNET
ncbi:5'-methylthioadenosine/S-adenosylhomocysteine nucleosidase [Roseicitreum antarcticum]|uniref:Adenosylhomocysteine nucleosidase n=1 Tax=Roseicitreum antarcticum TaxID=564137 RepID=A0A1H3CYV5_9RHOB|nr:5'-methylthioadenosine/S-adenosylhomocysteine nucleosidase [Roseicitreum antarcticum]SDX59210.1 adenosylhomocysteine nucleosidase [Roseicitreum antarcticum]